MSVLDPVSAAILGLVEGVTEYLPVSSTGHLIIVTSLLNLNDVPKADADAFNIVIQGGAILAVLGLYRARVAQILQGFLGRNPAGLRLGINLLAAFFPAAIVGLLLKKKIDTYLFYPGPVMGSLLLGGVVMIFIGRWQRQRFPIDATTSEPGESSKAAIDIEHLTWKGALVIGLLQCLSLWPGTSRSMVTIVGGMLVGMRPKQAAEFSFLLGLPTLGAACLYSGAKNLAGEGPNMLDSLGLLAILIGLAVATISAALAVRWLVGFLNKHGLALFGWYRIALCVVLGVLLWSEAITFHKF